MRQRLEDAGRQVEFIVIVDITIIGVFIVVRMIIIARSRPACLLPPKRSLLPSGFPTKFNSFQSSVYHRPQRRHHPSRSFNTLIINLVIVKCQHPVLRSCCTIMITIAIMLILIITKHSSTKSQCCRPSWSKDLECRPTHLSSALRWSKMLPGGSEMKISQIWRPRKWKVKASYKGGTEAIPTVVVSAPSRNSSFLKHTSPGT